MRKANDSSFRDVLVSDERALNLGCPHPVARDVDDIIDAPGDPVIPVAIASTAISGEIFARIGREIGLHEAFMITKNGTHLARPRISDNQVSLASAFQYRASSIHNFRSDSEER